MIQFFSTYKTDNSIRMNSQKFLHVRKQPTSVLFHDFFKINYRRRNRKIYFIHLFFELSHKRSSLELPFTEHRICYNMDFQFCFQGDVVCTDACPLGFATTPGRSQHDDLRKEQAPRIVACLSKISTVVKLLLFFERQLAS